MKRYVFSIGLATMAGGVIWAATTTRVENLSTSGGLSVANTTFDTRLYGAKCDGVTDDTAAVNSAISAAYASGGGIVQFPGGACLIAGQITIPNTGGGTPYQPGISIRGVGRFGTWRAQPSATTGGTLLLMTANPASGGKITTLGSGGVLEIAHLTMKETSSLGTAPFIYTTSTILHVHDVGAFGFYSGTACNQDFIVLGGTSTTFDGTVTSPFQGYGTVIEANFMDHLRRFVWFRTYANAVQVVNNTIQIDSGSNLASGAAIDLDGGAANAVGNYIAGNLIEEAGYPYPIRVISGSWNVFIGNGGYDKTATTLAHYRFESGTSGYNFVVQGAGDDGIPGMSDANSPSTNTFITGHQGQTSTVVGIQNFLSPATMSGFTSSGVSSWAANSASSWLPITLKNTNASGTVGMTMQANNGAVGTTTYSEDSSGNASVSSANGGVLLTGASGGNFSVSLGGTNQLSVAAANSAFTATSANVSSFKTSGGANDAILQIIAGNGANTLYLAERNGGQTEIQTSSASGNIKMIPGGTGNFLVSPGGTTKFQINSNGHHVASGTALTTGNLSSCGTSPAIAANSTDVAGQITEGTTATGCTITFAATYTNAPFCTCASGTAAVAVTCTTTPTTLVIANISASGDVVTYVCVGQTGST